MCNVATLSIRALKRKANNLKRGFKKSDEQSIRFLQSNLPKFKDLSIDEIKAFKVSLSDCLHSIAKSKGFQTWSKLLDGRLDYVLDHVDDHKSDNTFCGRYLHIDGVRNLKKSLPKEFISSLPPLYRIPTEKLIQDSEIFIDHQDEIENKKEDSERQIWYHYIVPTEDDSGAKLMIVFNLLFDFLPTEDYAVFSDHIQNFYGQVLHSTSVTAFERLKTDENDDRYIKHIDEIISTYKKPKRTMKDCPLCNSPNSINATECAGCGYEFDIIQELRRI